MIYRIEPARYEHLPWLRMLYMRWMAEQPIAYPESDASDVDNFVLALADKIRTENSNFVLLVAIKGRRVVGFIGGDVQERLLGKPKRYGRALWIYVVPKHRQHGCAAQLMEAGGLWMRTQNVDVVEVDEMGNSTEWERRGLTPYMRKYWIPLEGGIALSQEHRHGQVPNGRDYSTDALTVKEPHGTSV